LYFIQFYFNRFIILFFILLFGGGEDVGLDEVDLCGVFQGVLAGDGEGGRGNVHGRYVGPGEGLFQRYGDASATRAQVEDAALRSPLSTLH
jgi:hypothetical protein